MASTTSSKNLMGRYEILEPLRGIASLWVFLKHYHFSAAFITQAGFLHEFIKVGGLGVAMFFVISGFCLALAARRSVEQGESPLKFLGRRAWRIYPTFWASIVFILLLRGCVMLVVPASITPFGPKLPAVPSYTWLEWLKVLTLSQQFDPKFGNWFSRFSQVNAAYWSLAIEFQFYIIVSLALYFPKYFYRILGILAAVTIPFAIWNKLFFYSVHTGIFLAYWPWFALGIATFWLLEKGLTPERFLGQRAERIAWLYGGLIVLTVAVLAAYKIRINHFTFAGATAVGIWLSTSVKHRPVDSQGELERLIYQFVFQPLAVLGAMSYSLYLVHNEAYYSLQRLMMWQGVKFGVVADLLVACGTLIIAYLFYRGCELPFLRTRAKVPAAAPQVSDVPIPVAPVLVPSLQGSSFSIALLQQHLSSQSVSRESTVAVEGAQSV